MKTSDTLAALAPAIIKARAAIKTVGKDATNPHFKNRYASLEAISEAVTPALTANGLVALHSATLYDGGALTVTTRLLHTSGEWVEGGVTLPLGKLDPQGAGSAVSYGRRYGLAAVLGIVTDEDDDGNAASAKPATSTTKAAAPASKPAPTSAKGARTMPFGRFRGTPLAELPVEELERTLAWCTQDAAKVEKFKDLIADLEREIASAVQPTTGGDDDDLGF